MKDWGIATCPHCGRKMSFYFDTGVFKKHRTDRGWPHPWCYGSGIKAVLPPQERSSRPRRRQVAVDPVPETPKPPPVPPPPSRGEHSVRTVSGGLPGSNRRKH